METRFASRGNLTIQDAVARVTGIVNTSGWCCQSKSTLVMMYVHFPLSLRNVEDLFFERGIDICHETVRL